MTPAAAAADEVRAYLLDPDCRTLANAYSVAIGVIFRTVRRSPEDAAEIVAAVEGALDVHHDAASTRLATGRVSARQRMAARCAHIERSTQ